MTHPTAHHLYGQMQHQEYEAQAAQQAPERPKGSEQSSENEGMIMGKVAQLLQQIREQIASQPRRKAASGG